MLAKPLSWQGTAAKGVRGTRHLTVLEQSIDSLAGEITGLSFSSFAQLLLLGIRTNWEEERALEGFMEPEV